MINKHKVLHISVTVVAMHEEENEQAWWRKVFTSKWVPFISALLMRHYPPRTFEMNYRFNDPRDVVISMGRDVKKIYNGMLSEVELADDKTFTITFKCD